MTIFAKQFKISARWVSAFWGRAGVILDCFSSFVNMIPALFFCTSVLVRL